MNRGYRYIKIYVCTASPRRVRIHIGQSSALAIVSREGWFYRVNQPKSHYARLYSSVNSYRADSKFSLVPFSTLCKDLLSAYVCKGEGIPLLRGGDPPQGFSTSLIRDVTQKKNSLPYCPLSKNFFWAYLPLNEKFPCSGMPVCCVYITYLPI